MKFDTILEDFKIKLNNNFELKLIFEKGEIDTPIFVSTFKLATKWY